MSGRQLSDYMSILGREAEPVLVDLSPEAVRFNLDAAVCSVEVPAFSRPEVAEAWRMAAAGLVCRTCRAITTREGDDPKAVFMKSIEPRLPIYANGKPAFIGPATLPPENDWLTVLLNTTEWSRFGVWVPQDGVQVLEGNFEQIYPKN